MRRLKSKENLISLYDKVRRNNDVTKFLVKNSILKKQRICSKCHVAESVLHIRKGTNYSYYRCQVCKAQVDSC